MEADVSQSSASQSGGPRTGNGPRALRCRSVQRLKKWTQIKCFCVWVPFRKTRFKLKCPILAAFVHRLVVGFTSGHNPSTGRWHGGATYFQKHVEKTDSKSLCLECTSFGILIFESTTDVWF